MYGAGEPFTALVSYSRVYLLYRRRGIFLIVLSLFLSVCPNERFPSTVINNVRKKHRIIFRYFPIVVVVIIIIIHAPRSCFRYSGRAVTTYAVVDFTTGKTTRVV